MAPRPKPRVRSTPGNDKTMRQITVRLPKLLLDAMDELTAGRLDQPDRSAVIRELLAEAIAARKKKGRSDQG